MKWPARVANDLGQTRNTHTRVTRSGAADIAACALRPADAALLRELRGLERRRGSSGRDRVDHRPGEHDDRANVIAGAAFAARPNQAVLTTEQFVAFLPDLVVRQPRGKEIHIIVDNLSAHKTQRVQEFLAAHPSVHLHYTPTYSSWLNTDDGGLDGG